MDEFCGSGAVLYRQFKECSSCTCRPAELELEKN